MIPETTLDRIKTLAERYPRQESALIPAMDEVQRANGNFLSKDDVHSVADLLKIPRGRAWGVATYYTMFNTKPVGKYHLQVDVNVPGMLMGADEIVAHLEKSLGIKAGDTTADGLFTLSKVEDLGSCGSCPVIQVNDTYFETMTIEKTDALIASLRQGAVPTPETQYNVGGERTILMKNRTTPGARTLAVAKAGGAYQALAKARTMAPSAVIDEVKASTLRGRGGAGFPAGMKWGFLPKNDPRPVYLICNADEGEPGTFKDRQIMEYDPHLLIEGMAIAAHAIGSKKAFIYIRGEFLWIAQILEKAVAEATEAGLLGDLDIIVHRGAGSYVCGEETALIESIEGKRGNPRLKPPFPANSGLYACPTIVNNVETYACVPFIITHGTEAFRQMGNTGGYGPKIFGVSGQVNKPGVYEFPLGTPLTTILEAAGGVKGKLKGVIVGGLSVPILKPEEIGTLLMDYDSCVKAGTMLGSGGIMVINDTMSIPKIAARAIHFYAHESCGQCTPCREGSQAVKHLLHKLLKGQGTIADIERILDLCGTINGLTLCPTGAAFAVPIRSMIEKYRSEFEALVKG